MKEEFNVAVVSPTVPRAVGERSERSLKLNRGENAHGLRLTLVDLLHFLLIGKKYGR